VERAHGVRDVPRALTPLRRPAERARVIYALPPMLKQVGRYRLLKRLSAGGMGEVFLARADGVAEPLVVKCLLPHLCEDKKFVNMFFDEARIASAMTHPSVVRILDMGGSEGTWFLAMEYVRGQNIRGITQAAHLRNVTFPVGLECRIVADVASALHFAHRARNPAGELLHLVHRDVTPHNVMVGYDGAVKLIDFGVAKARDRLTRTATGVIKGKCAYMSPEQSLGRELDGRSDVFSLGICLHELLTGERLFRRDTDMQTLNAVATAPIPRPSELASGVSRGLDAVAMKALERDPEQRFQSGGELRDALEEVITRQRLPATATHLGAFLRALFPTESAADPLAEMGGDGDDVTQRSAPAPTVAERTPRSDSGVDLAARLAACGEADQAWGLFFNAALETLAHHLSERAAEGARTAALEPREWLDALSYPTAGLLRVLYAATRLLTPPGDGPHAPFEALGRAAGRKLLEHPVSAQLAGEAGRRAPPDRLVALSALLAPLLQPGERQPGAAAAGSLSVVLKGEVLPVQWLAGLYAAVLEPGLGRGCRWSFEKTTPRAHVPVVNSALASSFSSSSSSCCPARMKLGSAMSFFVTSSSCTARTLA
jgi:serine/threonine-protein kinase